MKRKVIQIAESTQLISLPRQWSKKYNVKKGDELEVIEKDNVLEVSTKGREELLEIEINITGLNRTSIYHTLRSAYQRGYDVIKVRFDKKTTLHYRLGKEVLITTVLHEELRRWVGMQIIEQKENYFVYKSISKSSFEEFELMFRRTFLLLLDACDEFLKAAEERDEHLLMAMDDKFYNILTFIIYCQRLLNKVGYSEKYKTSLSYDFLTHFNMIGDILRYGARDLLKMKKINKKTVTILQEIFKTFRMYYDLFYKFDLQRFSDLYKRRDEILRDIDLSKKDIPVDDLMLIVYCRGLLEIVVSLMKITATHHLKIENK